MSRPLTPQQLHHALEVAPTVKMTFRSVKRMMNYRQNLYRVNNQGEFRYATRREGWSTLVVMRLK